MVSKQLLLLTYQKKKLLILLTLHHGTSSTEKILVTGVSGGGKSFSLRFLDPVTTLYVRPTTKTVCPIRGASKRFIPLSADKKTGNVITITNPLMIDNNTGSFLFPTLNAFPLAKARKFKVIVFDDMQYVLLHMERAAKGLVAFKDGRKIYEMIKRFVLDIFSLADMESNNITCVFLWQRSLASDDLVVPGNAWREVIVPQGYFNIVMEAGISETGDKGFHTNNFGLSKSPYEMLEPFINNDVKSVLDKALEYYND